MAIIDNLRWVIGADSREFRREMDRAQRSVRGGTNDMSRQFNQLGRQLRTMRNLVLGLVGVGGFGALINEVTKTTDEIGKLSQSTGIATETLSTLRFVASQSGTSLDTIVSSLTRLTRNMDSARRGTGEAAEAFDLLDINVTDAAGNLRDSEDVLLDIADSFAQLEDGAQKSALAVQLFGRQGTELIPFLNQGRDGIEALQQRARELGLEISTDTALAAAEFQDNLDELQSSVRGLAESIIGDALPALNQYTKTVRFAYEESGALTAAWVALGGLGEAVFGRTLQQEINSAARAVQRLEEEQQKWQDLLERQAESRWARFVYQDANVLLERNAERLREARAELERLQAQQERQAEGERRRQEQRRQQQEQEAAARRRATEALREQQEARRAAERAEAEAQARQQRGEQVIRNLEREIELFGQVSQVEQTRWEIARGQYADLSAAQQRRILDLAAEQDALREAAEAEAQANAEKQAYEQTMERLAEQVMRRTRTEQELLNQEIDQLNQLLREGRIDLETYGRAMDDVRERMAAMGDQADDTGDEVSEFARQAARNAQDAFANFLFDPFDGGIKGMVAGFADAMRRMLAEALAAQAIQAALSAFGGGAAFGFNQGGEVQGFADGGQVHGPGTTTSDSIPARLSRGEFVQPADSASYYGMDAMEAMRQRRLPREAVRGLLRGAAGLQAYRPKAPRFADGGAVGGQDEGGSGQAPGVRIVNVVDPSMMEDYMTSSAGERVVVNTIRRNAGAIRQALG